MKRDAVATAELSATDCMGPIPPPHEEGEIDIGIYTIGGAHFKLVPIFWSLVCFSN